MAQLGVISADQRISGRHRAIRHASVQATHGQREMVEMVFAQDDDRSLSAQTSVDQGLTNASGVVQHLGKADVLPLPGAAIGQAFTLGHKAVLRRGFGPMHQLVRHARGKRRQLHLGAHIKHAFTGIAHLHAAHAKFQLTVARLRLACRHFFVSTCACFLLSPASINGSQLALTLAARPSRNSCKRNLASGALWAMAAISASVIRPWSAGCSEIRGKACISA